ncbi:hypothetical protein DI396_05355 [Litorivita pollutaquae]|uniref:Uncharacterized protein n=1 Tax=Litorivita pollutaquae TaxID=2200892 RepID=A0A2V4MS90_9RHOB|nr:hypothetical protein [Litorivita pollutaquae]PYC48409.1 hypothetical protein DI396_05355 [Litorivita pollutaquae]
MNVNQVINMVMRQVMRRVVNKGIGVGMNSLSRIGGDKSKQSKAGQGDTPPSAPQVQGGNTGKRMRQSTRLMRRIGRF